MKSNELKPPLKWAGGKRWLVPRLQPIWEKHQHRRFVEPLCGGLAVPLGLMPQRALLNDINPHLMNFYRWAGKGFRIGIKMENDEDLFYGHRELFNKLISNGKADSRKAAELFYFLNRTGFNGLCRFNKSGLFNVPFGKYKQINYTRDFRVYRPLFSKWEFTNGSFEEVALEKKDFVYADPPYDVDFRQYSKDGFAWRQQVKLAEWLSKHPGPVALSNQATERIVKLYTSLGFQLQYLDGPRRISCKGDRTPAKEVLATKGI